MQRNFALFADFHQFVLRDAEADWVDLAGRWTPDAVKEMFVQGDGYIAVGTARNAVVPVTVRIEQSEPASRPDEGADRIVSAQLPLPSGELVVSGVTDNEASGGRITVEPGTYQARVIYSRLDSLSADGLRGEDRYEIELWPRD